MALDGKTHGFKTQAHGSQDLDLKSRIPELDGRRGLAIVAATIAYELVRCIFTAASTPFWYDEICTWIIIRQPSVSGMYDALRHAADSNPPPFYLIERFSASVIENQQIALRLPSIIAFAVVLMCVFLIVKKTSTPAVALVCTSAVLITTLYEPYATEARPYSLVMACIAFALVCYQRAPAARWVFLLAMSLALAESLHYYSIFSALPFGCAEGAYFLRTKQFRWSVWLAFLCALVPLVAFWPLLAQFKAHYAAHTWATPTIATTTPIYGWLFHTATPIGIGVLAVLFVFVLVIILLPGTASNDGADNSVPELVLILALLALPLVVFAATKIAHGMMTGRYVLATVFGMTMACGRLLQWLGRRGVAVFAAFVLFVVLFQERSFWVTHRGNLTKVHTPTEDIEGILSGLTRYSGLPVVISDGLDYLPIVYYASPEQARRFVSLADPAQAVLYQGNDSVDILMLVQRPYAPIQVYSLSEFVAGHPRFLLYSRGGPFDWWPARLVREGYSLRPVVADRNVKVYLVDTTDISNSQP